jgi:hypothetical protein
MTRLVLAISIPRPLWQHNGDARHKAGHDNNETVAPVPGAMTPLTSVPIPKFASFRGNLVCELRNRKDTSNLLN